MKERKEVPETTRMRHVANRIVRARHRIPTEPMSRGVLYQCCMWLLKPFFWLISPRLDVHKKNDDQFSSIDDPFAAAAAAAKELTSLSVSQKLRLYGLYKQATAGDAPATAPSAGVLDPAAPLKWRSWASLRGMAAAAARDQYVHAVRRAASGDDDDTAPANNGRDDDIDDEQLEALDEAMGSMAGPVMSAMSTSAEEEAELMQADRKYSLHAAARQGQASTCVSLLNRGMHVDAPDEDDHTALHWACDGGHVAVAEVLLKRGAKVDAANCDGSTPLHMACACEHLDIARLLVRAGADATLVDADGCTPLDLCGDAAMREALR